MGISTNTSRNGRGLDFPQGGDEVLHPHFELGQALVGDAGQGEIDLGHDPSQADHGGLAAQGLQVGADEAVGNLGHAGPIDVAGQRHPAAVDFQNLQPADAVRNRNRDFAVKPAGPAQCRVEHIGQVGGGDHDDVLAAVKSVHQGQQLGDDALFDVAYGMLALGRDGVDLVEKDDTGACAVASLENLAQMRFAFAVELMDDLRAVDRKEVGLGFVCDGARDQGLAASGRSIEQHAFGWIDPQALEHLGIAQRAVRWSRGCAWSWDLSPPMSS